MSESLGILSMNVAGLPFSMPAPKPRMAELCRRIEASGADVVSLQEVWTRALHGFIRARLPSFGHAAWRPGPAGQPAGGLVTFSRRPLAAVTYTSLRGTGPRDGTRLFRGLKALNARLQGVLTAEPAGLPGPPMVLGNTHLSSNRDGDWSAGNRHYGFQRAQVEALHRILAGTRAGVTVLGGDLNIAGDGPLYPLVTGGGTFHDPFGPQDRPTFHADLLPAGRPARRIDYLLVAGADAGAVSGAELLFTEPVTLPGGRRTYLSDHCALMLRVAVRAGPAPSGT